MEKKIIELDVSRFRTYNDNLARQPEPERERKRQPEIKPAPKKGVRIHSLPQKKSSVRLGWIAAMLVVAALYMTLVSQYMTLTELSLEASDYEASIRTSSEEISKLKKFTLNQITDEELDTFVRKNDMDVLERNDVEYIDSARGEVIINHTGEKNGREAVGALAAVGEKLETFFEFFR